MLMNWYRLFRLAFDRTKSQKLTVLLSKQIFYIVKNNFGKNANVTLPVDEQCDLFLYINYVGDIDLFGKNFYIEVSSNYDKNKELPLVSSDIQFNLSLNKDFSQMDFPKLYYGLYDAVRHELGHYWQYLDPNFVHDNNMQNSYGDLIERYRGLRDYILLEREIDPFIRGLVFSAQKQRKPFSLVLDERLDELMFENQPSIKQDILSSLGGKEIETILADIKNKVISKAKQIYPDTRLL